MSFTCVPVMLEIEMRSMLAKRYVILYYDKNNNLIYYRYYSNKLAAELATVPEESSQGGVPIHAGSSIKRCEVVETNITIIL